VIGIVVSRADDASVAIGEQLRALKVWETVDDPDVDDASGGGTVDRIKGFELRSFDALHLNLSCAAEPFTDVSMLVFVSRHAGESGPLLTAHFTGNFGPAEYGGNDGELAVACPNAHKRVLEALRDHAPEPYAVGMECTHHGPSSLEIPSMFVEIGSSDDQWQDPAAAEAVARSVLALEGVDPFSDRTIVGFGGGHYVPRFERITRETDWAVGHVAADWALEAMGDLDPAIIEAAFDRSRSTDAVIDGENPKLASKLEHHGFRVLNEIFLRETEGVPLELVDELEGVLKPVMEGLRFGSIQPQVETYDIVEVDPALLDDAQATDRHETHSLVSDHAIAFETTEGGNRITGRMAVVDEDAYDHLIQSLVALLQPRFESLERRENELVGRERVFDPKQARALGVEEGPAFGRLAEGEAVEVDGKSITPSMVTAERIRRYQL
jgi:D-aminoacyl-tRNA deacylase